MTVIDTDRHSESDSHIDSDRDADSDTDTDCERDHNIGSLFSDPVLICALIAQR